MSLDFHRGRNIPPAGRAHPTRPAPQTHSSEGHRKEDKLIAWFTGGEERFQELNYAVWTPPSPHGPPPASRDVIDLAADSGAQLPYGASILLSKFDAPSSVRIALLPVVVSPVFVRVV